RGGRGVCFRGARIVRRFPFFCVMRGACRGLRLLYLKPKTRYAARFIREVVFFFTKFTQGKFRGNWMGGNGGEWRVVWGFVSLRGDDLKKKSEPFRQNATLNPRVVRSEGQCFWRLPPLDHPGSRSLPGLFLAGHTLTPAPALPLGTGRSEIEPSNQID